MKKAIIILLMALCAVLTASPGTASTPNVIGMDMKIIDNNIIVDLSVENVAEFEATINSGIEKEIVFTVELLRVWNFWPDEFVVSKKIKKVIRYDNLREQYRASSYDGIIRTEKKFSDYASVKNWIFSVHGINLAHIKELDPGRYYIRAIVESKSLKQLPLTGFLMHFIPEVEMSLARESGPFLVETGQ